MDLPNPNVQNPKVDLTERDVVLRSASAVPPPPDRKLASVAKLIDVSKCIGCKACQSACLEWNDMREEVGVNVGVYDNPHDLTPNTFTLMRFSEWVNPDNGNLEWLIRKDGCMHCEDPGCLKACPAPGAIVKYSNGIVDFVHENCIGCGYCVEGCPFNIPRISKVDHKAYKCTLCSDRIAVGQGPACAKACPTQCISFGSKEEMLKQAEGRIEDLKSRGYAKAGVYDPPGVGGTHVIYVLHHADKPEIYAGLPNNPRISPLVELWKGAAKYAGMAVIAITAALGLLHHVVAGANRVKPEDEENAKKLAKVGTP
jgi:formate dehydrogenase iron-sulfur subunit